MFIWEKKIRARTERKACWCSKTVITNVMPEILTDFLWKRFWIEQGFFFLHKHTNLCGKKTNRQNDAIPSDIILTLFVCAAVDLLFLFPGIFFVLSIFILRFVYSTIKTGDTMPSNLYYLEFGCSMLFVDCWKEKIVWNIELIGFFL